MASKGKMLKERDLMKLYNKLNDRMCGNNVSYYFNGNAELKERQNIVLFS